MDTITVIEPVALDNFLITFVSAGLVIMAATGYAIGFALSKTRSQPKIRFIAYLCYAILLISLWVLSRSANFSDSWLLLSLLMAAGYFFAPIGIWHLCARTHHHSNSENTS